MGRVGFTPEGATRTQEKPSVVIYDAWQLKRKIDSQIDLRSFDNFARFNTASADLHAAVAAGRKLDANGLQIRIEPAARFVVSMRNIVSKLRTFSADVASLCHR
jgi:hypothetical protein